VDGKEVDLARQLRVAQPNVPWLGGADRHLDVALDVPDLANELGGADGSVVLIVLLAVPAQDVLIADHHAIDRIGVLIRHADQGACFLRIDVGGVTAELLLGLDGAVDPRSWHELEAVARGDLSHLLATVGRAIGSDVFDVTRHQGEVALDLLLARFDRWWRLFGERRPQEAHDPA
jgi:hypothetical protein